MADEPETTAPPDTPEWRQKIEDQIAQVLAIVKGGGQEKGSETEPDEPASMAAEVRREVERLRTEEAKQQREADRDAEVGQLREKVAAIPEKQPREYRRSTRIMRWTTEDDK